MIAELKKAEPTRDDALDTNDPRIGTDAERAELARIIAEMASLWPDMRMTQIVCNLATLAGAVTPGEMWELPDGELLRDARSVLANARRRAAGKQPA